ncbi:MAG: L-threonylcarbamoyladenylate synthase [Actinomycetota bacterium]|nr:L-threonylcarbamoyladenylate synthase [Actinomycetota bacterium]
MNRLRHDEAVAALRSGEVVAVPTDTVYGVAARLHDRAAVARLFEVKRRPRDVALPVLIASPDALADLDVEWGPRARALAENFWPGPLTIVVGAAATSAALVGATSTLGLRVPRHEGLTAILAECGPLAVTSANGHGEAPCISADDVLATTWGARVAGVFDGGTCDATVSSVVELTSRGWRLLRSGALSATDIATVIGPESGDDDQ